MNSRNRVIGGILFAAVAASCGMTFGGTNYSYALPDSDIAEVDNIFPGTSSAKTAFTGLNLSEWRVAGGALQGYSCARTVADGMPAYATNEYRTNGVYDVQLQGYEGEHIKCVKIRLWQDGADVKVKAISAAYCYSVYRTNGGYKLGVDLDLDQVGSNSVATGPQAAGYGVKKIVLVKVGSEITATDTYAEGDTITVGDWTRVTIDASTACAAYMPQMNVPLGAELTLTNLADQTFGDVFRGTGAFRFEASPRTPAAVKTSAWNYTKWTVIAENADLCDVTDVTVDDMYSFGNTYPNVSAWHFFNDGVVARVQLQTDDGTYIRCIVLQLRQNGANIEAQTVGSQMYLSKQKGGLGYDFETQPSDGSIGIQGPGNGAGIENLGLVHSNPARLGFAVDMKNIADVAYSDFIIGRAVRLGIDSKDRPPTYSRFIVLNGGRLSLDASGDSFVGYVSGKIHYTVLQGGTLHFRAANTSDSYGKQKVLVRGGTLAFFPSSPGNAEYAGYLNFLTLEDGAHLRGVTPRVGYTANAEWMIRGSSPSFIDSGIQMVKSTATKFTLKVADVTGDAEPDLFIGTKFTYLSGNADMSVYKKGTGTVSVGCPCNYPKPTYVEEGTWLLTANATQTGKMIMSLNGGTLAAAASTTNSFAALALTKNSGLALGKDAELAFADTSAESWPAGTRLSVVGDLEQSFLRFGTDASGLTAGQLSCIRVNGHRAVLDENGYIHESIPGMMLIFR